MNAGPQLLSAKPTEKMFEGNLKPLRVYIQILMNMFGKKHGGDEISLMQLKADQQ